MSAVKNPGPDDNAWPPTASLQMPPVAGVAVSVVAGLIRVGSENFQRTVERNLTHMRAMADARDLATLIEQQQSFMRDFWSDQETALAEATDVLRDGFEQARHLQNSLPAAEAPAAAVEAGVELPALPAPDPLPADPERGHQDRHVAIRVSANPANAVFEITRDAAGEFFFTLTSAEGAVLLRSEGYRSRPSAVNGIASVRKNSVDDARYDRVDDTGAFAFHLKAANHQVVGSSDAFASADARDAVIDTIKLAAAYAVVDDRTGD